MRYTTLYNHIPLQIHLGAPDLGDLECAAPGEYTDGPYELTFAERALADGLLLSWRVRRRDGRPFNMTETRAEAAVPGLDLHRIFVPVLHEAIGKLDRISLPWGVEERSFTSWSFPFIAALNRYDQNRFCIGFMDHVHAAEATHGCYDEDANIGLRRLFDQDAPAMTEWGETLYISCEGRPVFDAVRAFSRAYDQVNEVVLPSPPPAVWEPVWCSWYGIKNDVDAEYIRGMAPLLKEWGVGNIIVDAGWFKGDGFDPETGHYVPDESKFPDLAGLVKEVQAQGLTILLWCAPLFNLGGLGKVPFIQAHRFRPAGKDAPEDFLCPRCPAVRAYARRTVQHLMETYGCNGLKIDFIDPLMDRAALPCSADHEHDIADYGEAVEDLLAGIYRAATQVRADALIEYRMNYSTLATRPYATSHRAQDAPFDPDHIRRMCTRLKSYILDPAAGRQGNVAVHTDPAYWLPGESPENVARFMASLVLSAVPMLSMDLRALPAEHQRITRAWLEFYRQHSDLLLFGRQQLLDADPHHSLYWQHLGDEALLGAFTATFPGLLTVPAPDIGRMWIVNGGAQKRLCALLEGVAAHRLRIQVYDRVLEPISAVEVPVAEGAVRLDMEVEIGGVIELTAAS